MNIYRFCPDCGEEIIWEGVPSDEEKGYCSQCGWEGTVDEALEDPEND